VLSSTTSVLSLKYASWIAASIRCWSDLCSFVLKCVGMSPVH
jgi:hypothetical protein